MEAHTPKVRQAYVAGAGASGALLAGAAIVFISLVGLVSSTVWPDSDYRVSPMNAVLDPAGGPVGGPESQEIPATAPGAPAAAAPAPAPPPPAPASAADPKGNAAKSANDPRHGRKSGSEGDAKVTTAPPATVAPVPSVPDSSNPGRSSGETGSSGGKVRSGNDSASGGSVKRASRRSSLTKPGKGKRLGHAQGGSTGHGQAKGLEKHGP